MRLEINAGGLGSFYNGVSSFSGTISKIQYSYIGNPLKAFGPGLFNFVNGLENIRFAKDNR